MQRPIQDEITEYLATKLTWQKPLLDEKEPDFTARVILPQVENMVRKIKLPLALRSDGKLRPQPVFLGGQPFYPDLAINSWDARFYAVEVKFFSGLDDRNSLLKGLGQIMTYTSFGYQNALLLGITREGNGGLSRDDLDKLNNNLPSNLHISLLGP